MFRFGQIMIRIFRCSDQGRQSGPVIEWVICCVSTDGVDEGGKISKKFFFRKVILLIKLTYREYCHPQTNDLT